MKTNVVARSGKPETMELCAKPMTIWLSRQVQLVIEKGDRLSEVVAVVVKTMQMEPARARQLVAYWFALGERIENGCPDLAWTKSELHVSDGRRYLDRRPK